jgi:AcrR family transcriptional regulator
MKKTKAKPSPKKDRREQILAVALKLFARNGVAHTKLLEVAKTAKVDPSLISYYFPTLDALYMDVVQKIIESFNGVMLEALSTHSRTAEVALEAYVKSYFRWATDHRGVFTVFLHFYHLASFKPEFTAINEVTRNAGRARIEAMIYRGMAEGAFGKIPAERVTELSSTIQAFIIGGVIAAFTERDPKPEVSGQQTWTAIHRLLA